jgi:gliding motility-associated protein GldM
MALPQEPRQKMINIMYLVLTAMLALNVSAEVIKAFTTVNKSLVNSNTNIETANGTLFSSLKSKLSDPQVDKEKLAKWTDAATKAKELSDNFNKDIEAYKLDLKTASGLATEGGVEKYKEDDLNASSRIFDTGGKGKELDEKLKAYKKAMLAIDPEIAEAFKVTFPVETDATQDATTPNFRMMPTVAAVTLLSKYQNNIKNAENQVVTYCHNKIGEVKVVYNKFAAIVGQSSNYLMPGEKMKITAGVGAFSTAAAPQITIGGAGVPVNADGVAEKEFSVDGGGAKSVPVSVTFTKPDGTKETKNYNMEYTVGQPGGAAVMLDKMNVFYIGVDNPVTISSGKGWDKTQASGNGCTLSGSGGKRTVRVSGGTTCSINVTAEGSPSTSFPFRIKRIPDPVFKIADGKSRMPAVSFKNQQYCRADLENFDFDLKYSIVSATVYFNGTGFNNVVTAPLTGNSLAGIASFIQRCGPGSSISFEGIKVSGPDGVRTIEGRSFQLY